ncbi:MAG: hypothetical protein KF778_12635 [Rhodocyclaceae bacterium]|nr:hypothetical protein [Rhodocyclaceae bacterium]MBX3669240.1 hypothetical protein [Rhodocyclaceae bacterium]
MSKRAGAIAGRAAVDAAASAAAEIAPDARSDLQVSGGHCRGRFSNAGCAVRGEFSADIAG